MRQMHCSGAIVQSLYRGFAEWHKLRAAAAGWNLGHDIAPLIDAIWALDKSSDVSELTALSVSGG
jgi:hypothetical protein